MSNNEFLSLGVKITDAETVEKLEILRLEKGISTHHFIVESITEKLKREGFIRDIKQHEKVVRKKKSDREELLEKLRKL